MSCSAWQVGVLFQQAGSLGGFTWKVLTAEDRWVALPTGHRLAARLPPSELAVVWRSGDQRKAVRVFADACCICTAA